MFTLNTLFNDLNRLTHKGSLNQTSDIFGAVWQAARNMISRAQPPELERMQFIEQALYNQVNRYAVPNDLDGNKIISMKLLSSRNNVGSWTNPLEQSYSEDFGMSPGIDNFGFGTGNNFGRGGHDHGNFQTNKLSIMYENGVKYVLLPNFSNNDALIINRMENLTENGFWNVSGNVVNLRADPLKYVTGKGSLAFDFNSSGTTGALENFTLQPVDIKEYLDIGAIFNWLDLANGQQLVSCKFIWASSLSDWYEYTVTAPHDGTEFTNGWNLLRFSLQDMTVVGTPNPSNINRIKFEFTTTGQPQVACHLDNIVARKGKVFTVNYYSTFFFRDPQTGNWKQQPTSGNDIINLEQDAYQILMYEAADALTQEITGNFKASRYATGTVDQTKFREKLDDLPKAPGDIGGLYWQYNRKYPSKLINPSADTYHFLNGHL